MIGCGEAGLAFAGAPGRCGSVTAFDIQTDDPARRDAKLAEYRGAGVTAAMTVAEALAGAGVVLSLVTADQALNAAQSAAPRISPGALYLDLNSVAPATKRAAAAVIDTAGGRYVDVAVMAPVHPKRLGVPLLVSGAHAAAAVDALRAIGFTSLKLIAGDTGAAASVKMIRSVVIKGVEALTAECMIAAARAGVVAEVLAALGEDWATRADYNLDRMMVHGLRRAAEMDEVAATLEGLGVVPSMTRATAKRQRELGALGLGHVAGLDAKLEALAA
ncbi:NAD(P)-dependent oxidoreductase [Glacieibacterium frigidum]|nr:NAD(P)-dependent oxidoreductase [Glacieibacterium frigidum]